MKKLFIVLIISCIKFSFGLIFWIVLSSCSAKHATDKAANDSQGRISVKLPWYSAQTGSYSMQTFELENVTSLRNMRGFFTEFFYAPSVKNMTLSGEAPQTSFMKSKNQVYIAKNTLSLEMAAIYKIMQDMHALDKELGVDGINSWPRKIGVSVRIADSNESNNAFYDGQTDSFLFLNYDDQRIPLAINSGVIVHEYFHSLFNKIINSEVYDFLFSENQGLRTSSLHDENMIRKIYGITDNTKIINEVFEVSKKSDSRRFYEFELEELYTKTFIDALNEGFADYWGYVYTQDDDFISKSISGQKARQLNRSNENLSTFFYSTESISEKIKLAQDEVKKGAPRLLKQLKKQEFSESELEFLLLSELKGYSYLIGSQYANWAKLLSQQMVKNADDISEVISAQRSVAQAILKALPKIKSQILSDKKSVVKSEDIMMFIYENLETTEFKTCEFFKVYLNAVGQSSEVDYVCTKSDQLKPKIEVKKKEKVKDSVELEKPEQSIKKNQIAKPMFENVERIF